MTTTENVLGFFLWGFITRTEVHAVLPVVIFIGGPFLASIPGGVLRAAGWAIRGLCHPVGPADADPGLDAELPLPAASCPAR